ncbi:MAG TPA: hypothetical protein VLL52_20110, partial [Anaerolineae bacterium]|nr:hypothetical protein [Anaerolineae bacterium]
ANYPPHDYYDTAVRLGRQDAGPRTVTAPAYQLGDTQTFFANDTEVTAELQAITPNIYMWVDTNLSLDSTDLQTAAQALEDTYYPRLTQLVGDLWQPGMDNDPHFTILHLNDFGENSELGYFISSDELPRSIDAESNEQEMIYLNMDELDLGSDLYYGTLIHEIQHLIQWYVDSNETTWMDEGIAQMAELHQGFETSTADDYLIDTHIPLNLWNHEDDDLVYAHYSAGYLLMVYFWEQVGETAMQELARHPADGLASVSQVLAGHQPDISLYDFLGNWMAANFLDDPQAGSTYHYNNISLDRPDTFDRINQSQRADGYETLNQLNQFGVHYIDLNVNGPTTISFVGDTIVDLVPAPPNGDMVWYVPSYDNLNAQLTATFDLRDLDQATLEFWAWYDLETDYDYAYIAVSNDNGANWELILPDHGVAGEYGPAFNGASQDADDQINGWVPESIPLTRYLGQEILIRFEVVTDSSLSYRSFALDEIAIPELNYLHNTDIDDGRWQANGFVRTTPQLPQLWQLRLLSVGGNQAEVIPLDLDYYNQGLWTFNLATGQDHVIAIMPQTLFRENQATYWLRVQE